MIARRQYLKRSAPSRKRRPGVRRGRVNDQQFMGWMHATQACLVTGKSVFELHHVRKRAGDQKDDRRVVALIADLHQYNKNAVEKIGDQRFQQIFHVDFELAIAKANAEYEARKGRAA